MFKNSVLSLILLTCLALLTGSLAHAQKSDDRIEIILGGLPPASSAEYKALLSIAGDPKRQVLSLTKCEVWSVDRSRVKRLQEAAAQKNISFKILGDGWNHVFQPMAKSEPMDEKHKAMMDMAMQSKSTAAVSMMSSPDARMVEYALTKNMSAKGGHKSPMSVKIALNDKLTITAVRKEVVIKGDRCTWRGVVEGTDYPVTIMWWGSGRMTGTVHYGDRLYQLKHMGKDVMGIVETMVDKMPDEHPRTPSDKMREMRMDVDAPFTQGDSSAMRPKRDDVRNVKDDADSRTKVAAVDMKAFGELARKTARDAARQPKKGEPNVVIDVMVAYTAKAAMHYGNIKLDLIDLAIEETNASFRASRIADVSVRLVHSHLTDYTEDGAEHFDHVWRMVDRGDGFLDEIPGLRDEKKADLVVLIVDDPKGCGLATRVAASADEGYAVVHHECAATTYSLAHEIGHLIGARHDRSIDKSTGPFAYGYGFVEPALKWRTMMSYKAGCNGCPRLLVWSTPAKVVKGRPAGDDTQNNARVIREQARRVSNFR
ncbi:MAG: hypothetical protein HC869_03835 [Rhodospirillales bacterium]|nr:hypothetical protein [Rhodospirillales bacterium]